MRQAGNRVMNPESVLHLRAPFLPYARSIRVLESFGPNLPF